MSAHHGFRQLVWRLTVVAAGIGLVNEWLGAAARAFGFDVRGTP